MTRPFYPAQTDYVEKLNALWDHVGVLWRGDWDAGAAYEVGDLARYGKDVWRRLVAGTTAGVPSADLTNWELFVEGGIDGIDGTNGTDGIDGTNGTNGLNGADGADGVDGVQPWTTPPVAWAATTIYTATAPANSVTYGGESYVCSTSHTSTGSFDATKWAKIAAKGADGAGSGDVSGPASAADGKVVLFDGTSGKLIKDSGLALSGSNTGDETGASVATLLHAASAKTTLVDADEVNGTNSASSWALIRTTWANVWTYIKSKADTFYAPKGAATASGLTLSTGKLLGRTTAGTGAIEEIEVGAFIGTQTAKTTLADADVLVLSDSAASSVGKKITWANFKLAIKTYTDTLYSALAGTATGAIDLLTGANIASASTVNLNTATGNRVHITGTTPITAVTLTRGPRTVIFDGILTLTHHATNNNLPGAANITTAAGDRAIYESDGTNVYCVGYFRKDGTAVVGAGAGDHCVKVNTGNGTGSTGTKIRRYTTTETNVGTAITYADSATLGATFTIAAGHDGFYAIEMGDLGSGGSNAGFGISVNSNQLTTAISAITAAHRRTYALTIGGLEGSCSGVFKLTSGDVVRAHGGNGAGFDTSNGNSFFEIRKVGTP